MLEDNENMIEQFQNECDEAYKSLTSLVLAGRDPLAWVFAAAEFIILSKEIYSLSDESMNTIKEYAQSRVDRKLKTIKEKGNKK